MAKLQIVDGAARRKGALAGRPTRRATLERLDQVAQERVGASPLDDAFARLEALGPEASERDVAAAQNHLRALLAAGLT